MIDHMGFCVRDLAASRRFYDACAHALGLQVIDNTADSFLIGRGTTQPLPFIWVGTTLPAFWSAAHVVSASPVHVGFDAPDREAVDAFYRAALAAGGRDNGLPGPRGPAEMKYYAAYVLDPDGNNIEAGVRGKSMSALVTEEMMVPSEPDIEIFVRNKRPANLSKYTAERTLLMVHGSTYPAHTGIDLPLGGQSWMESIASHGYDVYCLDVRGYGRSTRPKAMDEPPQNNPPVARTPNAVKDITAVLNFILKRRGLTKLNLLGWSWGCTLMATTTIQNPDKVARLVMYAPPWLRTTPSVLAQNLGPGPLGAYRTVTREQAKARWLNGVPEDKKAALIPPGWFEQWADACWATDPTGAKQNPPVLRAPNGTVADSQDFWTKGKPMYDPAQIEVPAMIAIGEWDHDTPPSMAQTIFPLMINSPGKRLVMLAEGTHHMMLEKNRGALFRAVQAFLDEGCE